ncbi:MAG: hypothetical protein A2Z47_07960 [Thermodesulfovibrio sp. RBG_19FT_COMBO_42_12]|nr:MAG: hypothetical protein A2Z47_07960 [Thermodesulfovibrio sp. RBG_19FT_COMBO_42_12]
MTTCIWNVVLLMALLVRYFKQVNGISYQRLSEVTGINSEILNAWLIGRQRPIRQRDIYQ